MTKERTCSVQEGVDQTRSIAEEVVADGASHQLRVDGPDASADCHGDSLTYWSACPTRGGPRRP